MSGAASVPAARGAGSPPWITIFVLAAAGVGLRFLIRALVGLDTGFGEDAEFWGYRAVELANGIWIGTHPPTYPAIVAILSFLPGSSAAEAATWVSFVTGALMPSAVAFAVAPLAGRRAATLCGWFTFFFPGLLAASLRVEPTGLFVLFVAAILYATIRATRDNSFVWGLVAGLAVALSTTVKENGLLYVVLLVPIVLVALARRRWLVALSPLAGIIVPLLLSVEIDTTGGAQASKASIPARDVAAFFEAGILPAPLLAKEDAAIAPTPEAQAEIADPNTSISRRFVLYAGLQMTRLARFLGLWLLVAPFVTWGAWRLWRTGGLAGWQAAIVLAMTACLAPAFAIPIQPRHAEPGALGIVVAVSYALVYASDRGWRWATPVALLLAAAQGAWLFFDRELVQIEYLARCAADQQQTAWQVDGWLNPDVRLCSPLHWVGFRTGRPVQECDGEGEDADVQPGADLWFVGSPDSRMPFEHKILYSQGTLQERARWESECFDVVTLEAVEWSTLER